MDQIMPQRYERLGTHFISQMGIKSLFYIFKPKIPFLPNSFIQDWFNLGTEWPEVEKEVPKNYTCKTLKGASKNDFIFSKEQFFF